METIKCISCGATQELTTEYKCGYCGSSIEEEKAVKNYEEDCYVRLGLYWPFLCRSAARL